MRKVIKAWPRKRARQKTRIKEEVKDQEEMQGSVWEDTVRDAIEILSDVATVTGREQMTDCEVLIEMVKEMVDKAAHPEESDACKELMARVEELEKAEENMKSRIREMSNDMEKLMKQTNPNKRKSNLARRLESLTKLLDEKLEEERHPDQDSAHGLKVKPKAKTSRGKPKDGTKAESKSKSKRSKEKNADENETTQQRQQESLKLLSPSYRQEYLNRTEVSVADLKKNKRRKRPNSAVIQQRLSEIPFASRSPR